MDTFLVKVAKAPGRSVEVAVEAGTTVGDAIRLAEFDATGYKVTLDGEPTELTAEAEDGSVIILSQKVKAG